MKKNSKYRQGIYTLVHPEKYKGNKNQICWRSSWECKMMKFLDHNPNVVEWSSEETIIPYANPLTGRISRYFVDFYAKMKDKSGELKKYLIEVKPHAQTMPPVQKNRKTKSLIYQQAEYVKNQAKWKSAAEYCAKRNMNFVILTEKQLGI
jgi:hypothetical protein